MRSVTSPSGKSFSSTCATLAWNASPDLASIKAFITVKACVWCRSFAMAAPSASRIEDARVLGRRVLAPEVVLRLHLAQAARGPREFAPHHRRGRVRRRRFREQLLGKGVGAQHELHPLIVEHVHEPREA